MPYNIKEAEALEEELERRLTENPDDPEFDDIAAELHGISNEVNAHYNSLRKTDESGKLLEDAETRTPAVAGSGDKSEWYFEPSVAEAAALYRRKPELLKQWGLQNWTIADATPPLSMVMNPEAGGVGMNTQPPKTRLDVMHKDSTPYRKAQEYLWRIASSDAIGRGTTLKRYRDTKFKGNPSEWIKGGITGAVTEGVAPTAMGAAAGLTADVARNFYDNAVQRLSETSREPPGAFMQVPTPDSMAMTPVRHNMPPSEEYSQPQPIDLPTSEELRLRNPFLYGAGEFASYGVGANPTNLLQRGLYTAMTEGSAKRLAQHQLLPLSQRVVASAVSGAGANVAEGAMRDYAGTMREGGTPLEALHRIGSNAPLNSMMGGGFGAAGEAVAAAAGANSRAFRENNPEFRTLEDGGGELGGWHGYVAPPEVQDVVDRSVHTRPSPGSPAALAAEPVAQRLQGSMAARDRDLRRDIGAETKAYTNHPVYGRMTRSARPLVDTVINMANVGRWSGEFSRQSKRIDPSLLQTVRKEASNWSDIGYVSKEEAEQLVKTKDAVVIDHELARDMYGDPGEVPAGSVPVIVPHQMTPGELITKEENFDKLLKSYNDSKVPEDPVISQLNLSIKGGMRDKFPAYEDEAGKLVDPPRESAVPEPFSRVTQDPEIRTYGPPVAIEPQPQRELQGIGPGQPDLPKNPFDPRLPTGSGLLDAPMRPDETRGVGIQPEPEPAYVPPEALLGVPRRDRGQFDPLLEQRKIEGDPSWDGTQGPPPAEPPPEPEGPPTGRMGGAVPPRPDVVHQPVYEGQLDSERLPGTDLERMPPSYRGEERGIDQLEGNGMRLLPEEAQPSTQRSPPSEDETPLSLLSGNESPPREPTEPASPRTEPAAAPGNAQAARDERLLTEGAPARAAESAKMGEMGNLREAFDQAEAAIRKVEEKFGKYDEQGRAQALLQYVGEKLGRPVTKEDLVKAGIIASTVAGATLSASDAQAADGSEKGGNGKALLMGALTAAGVGASAYAARRSVKGRPPEEPAAEPSRAPTKPGGVREMTAKLEDGTEVRGLSAMRRRQSQQLEELGKEAQRMGSNSDKSIRDRIINYRQGDDKIWDDALEAEAKRLGIDQQLRQVPAAGVLLGLKDKAFFGRSGAGFTGRAAQTLGPRAAAATDVLSGRERNPFATSPTNSFADLLRELLNVSGGRLGARSGEGARIFEALKSQWEDYQEESELKKKGEKEGEKRKNANAP